MGTVQRKYADVYVNTGRQDKVEKNALDPGHGFVRYNKCMILANRDPDKAAHIARKSYNDDFLHRQIKAMSVTTPSTGGFLVPEVYAAELIPLLRAKAIVLKLGATVLPMDNGNLNIPRMTSGTSAHYVGELRPGKTSTPKVGNLRMSSKKLMTTVSISNDLIRSNTFAADAMILNEITKEQALAMDAAALMGTGTEFSPLGVFKMKDIPKVAIDGRPDESTSGKLLAKLIQNNADTSKLGWGFNGFAWEAFYNVIGSVSGLYIYRSQMDEDKLTGQDFAISNQIPAGTGATRPTEIILGNWSEFLIGRQGEMMSEMFREGTITGADGQLISAVDTDSTILRTIDLHDFAVRHPESFVIGTGLQTAGA